MVSQKGMLKEGPGHGYCSVLKRALVHGLDRRTRGWLAGLGQ